jgi:DNA replicative helicase MCM subunit Mcm2 (Cdc46/Mcm family)
VFCQVALVIELDDVQDFDSELAKAIASNTRRYVSIAAEVIYEMLPDYKQREVRGAVMVSRHVV